MRLRDTGYGLIAFALIAAGCYTYEPIETVRPGMSIRAQLENEAAIRRSQGLDDPIVRYDGRVVEATEGELALDVLVARTSSAFQDVEIRDTVRLPRTEVRSMMERKFSPVRTGLITVGVVAGAVAVVLGVDAIVGGTGDDPGPGPDPTFRPVIMSLTGAGFSSVILGGRRQ